MIAARFGASYRVESEYTVATIEGSRAGRYRIDTAFPDQRLGIELDGFRFHARFPSAFKRHLARQNRLVGAGWRLLRYTRGELADIETILQQIQRVLQSQGSGEENQR